MLVQEQQKLTSAEIFKTLGDIETQRMLMEIAANNPQRDCMGMTRRAFYDRLRKLKTCSLIHKVDGVYKLTTFGTVIHYEIKLVNNMILNTFSFTIIDRLAPLPEEQKREILPKLIDGSILKRLEEAGLSVRECEEIRD